MTTQNVNPDPILTDPRTNFAHVVAVTGRLIQQTDPETLEHPTPCSEYDVATLTGHMVAVMARVSAVARGEDPFSVPQVAELPHRQSWHEAWLAQVQQVHADWADPAVLERDLTLPFGVLPGRAALTMYCGEIAVHAWDLATSTDRTVTFDDAMLSDAMAAVRFGLPAEGRGPEMPFGEVVETGPDAPVVEQLAGWMGRLRVISG